MSNDKLRAEQEAFQSLMQLINEAATCKALFEKAGLDLPEPLQRFLGMSLNGSPARQVQHTAAANDGTNPPPSPPRPSEAKRDCIWVPLDNALVQSVALAVMRREGRPMKAKEIGDIVSLTMTDVSVGSVYNLVSRLKNKVIRQTDRGEWELIDPNSAPILGKAEVWALPSIFGSHELAAHRRIGILHLLSYFTSGLQMVQIVEELRKCPWMKAPVSKDLVKADIEVLQSPEGIRGKKLRRRGNSKKWEAVNVRDDGD